MPFWVFIAIGLGSLLVLGALAGLGYFGWHAYERRMVFRLVGRAEGVEAAAAALVDAVSRLAEASDDEIALFASDPDNIERRAFAEVYSRASILATELDRMPLPQRLVPAAEAIADAATVVKRQAELVNDEDAAASVLEKIAEINLTDVRTYTDKARAFLLRTCDACGLDDTALYGGGLYL